MKGKVLTIDELDLLRACIEKDEPNQLMSDILEALQVDDLFTTIEHLLKDRQRIQELEAELRQARAEVAVLRHTWSELSCYVASMLPDGSGSGDNANCPEEVVDISRFMIRLSGKIIDSSPEVDELLRKARVGEMVSKLPDGWLLQHYTCEDGREWFVFAEEIASSCRQSQSNNLIEALEQALQQASEVQP
jgi:hypothetical protein